MPSSLHDLTSRAGRAALLALLTAVPVPASADGLLAEADVNNPTSVDLGTTVNLDLQAWVTLKVGPQEGFEGLTRVGEGTPSMTLSNPGNPFSSRDVFGTAEEWKELAIGGVPAVVASRGPGTSGSPGLVAVPLEIQILGAFSFSDIQIKLTETGAGPEGRVACELGLEPSRATTIAAIEDGTPTVEDFEAIAMVDPATGEGTYTECGIFLWLETATMVYGDPISATFTIEVTSP